MDQQQQPGPGEPMRETPPPVTAPPSKDEVNWAVFCHLAAFAVLIVPFFGNVIGPLVIWLIKREKMPFVDEHGKEAVNFQISMSIYAVAATILIIVAIGILLLPAVIIVDFIYVVIAAVAASHGKPYRYPFTIRLIK